MQCFAGLILDAVALVQSEGRVAGNVQATRRLVIVVAIKFLIVESRATPSESPNRLLALEFVFTKMAAAQEKRDRNCNEDQAPSRAPTHRETLSLPIGAGKRRPAYRDPLPGG